MRIGIVTPDISKDTSSAELFEAVSERADAVYVDPRSFKADINDNRNIWLGNHKPDFFDALILRRLCLETNPEFQYRVLKACENDGLMIINSLESVEIAESKMLTTMLLAQYGLPVPSSRVCQNKDEVIEFFDLHKDIVIKPLYGDLGEGIQRIRGKKDFHYIDRLLEDEGAVLLQKFIKSKGSDYRIFVIGDHVVGAIKRTASNGWITNIFKGGSAEQYSPSQQLRDLSVKSAQILGLEYCGVDIICQKSKPYILELNGSPAWEGLSGATGRNIPRDIVSHTIRKIKMDKKLRDSA